MDTAAFADQICLSTNEQINSIVQHHFTEVFLGNCTEGGIFLSTKSRKKVSASKLRAAFRENLLPQLAILNVTGADDKMEGTEGGKEPRIRFFYYDKSDDNNKFWSEVSFKKSTDIDEATRCAVLAYSKSADLYFRTSLYNSIFNAVDGRERLKRLSTELPTSSPAKKKLRYPGASKEGKEGSNKVAQKNSFGEYTIKQRLHQNVINLLPIEAMDVFKTQMCWSTRELPISEFAGYKTNEELVCVSKLPVKKKGQKVPSNLLYDPTEYFAFHNQTVSGLLCLTVGMEVSRWHC